MYCAASGAMPVRTKLRCPSWAVSVSDRRSASSSARTVSMVETAALGDFVEAVGGVAASVLPGVWGDVVRTLAGDAGSLVDLEPSTASLVRLGITYYLFFSTPAPVPTVMDFYVLKPLYEMFGPNFTSTSFDLRERLGGGNFGITYEAVLKKDPYEEISRGELSREEKNRRVVLKRVNIDRVGVRTQFLNRGTIAQGAAETGAIEAYMNGRLARNILMSSAAGYKGTFVCDESNGGFTKDTQWLVWDFESDCTLGDALEGKIGVFPGDVEEIVLGKTLDNADMGKRDMLVVQTIMKRLLKSVISLHGMGIVHRDLKPENILITNTGEIKLIDFGAAVDLSTGINFNPQQGMLDPRFSPPEELVLPETFPRAPDPALAATFAPVVWQAGRPDLFDSYSLGMMFVQMMIPELHTRNMQTQFAADISKYNNSFEYWRQSSAMAQRCDFTLLDRQLGLGNDLANRLIKSRNLALRGRLTPSDALNHPFFWLPVL